VGLIPRVIRGGVGAGGRQEHRRGRRGAIQSTFTLRLCVNDTKT
jgi:hypothetical protein